MSSIRLDTRELNKIARGLNANTDRVLGLISFRLEALAKTLAPVDTGALKNSIHTLRVGKRLWRVEDGVEYGIYQELGTYKMAAHPFMSPAAERVADDLNSGRLWSILFK